jgi:hypothetical protein
LAGPDFQSLEARLARALDQSKVISELVCSRLDETPALDQVAELGADREAVQGLAPGSFPVRNRISRGRLAGKLF